MSDSLICRWFGHKTFWVNHVEKDPVRMRLFPAYELRCKRCKKRLGYIKDMDADLTANHLATIGWK